MPRSTPDDGRVSIIPMRRNAFLLYGFNVSLIVCHEIDAARWHEWELFRLPGGATSLLALNLVLVPCLLVGLTAVATGHRWARPFLILTSFAGITASLLHLFLLGFGDSRFREPLSIALICGFGLSSQALLALAERWGRAFPSQQPDATVVLRPSQVGGTTRPTIRPLAGPGERRHVPAARNRTTENTTGG